VARPAEIRIVNLAGLTQGVALVTFPAVSTILTSPKYYGLSASQYGLIFVPQVVLAISAALAGARMVDRFGAKRLYLIGLLADLAAALLLLVSIAFKGDRPTAFAILMLATACLGAGFGLTVPVLNTLTAAFHPGAVDRSILTLNALLGLGTVLAPFLTAIFVGVGFWWGLPVVVSLAVVGIFFASLRLPLATGPTEAQGTERGGGLPARFWIFGGFAVLYGICETMSGNWSQLDMTDLGASVAQASFALMAFWGMVTIGRLVFAWIERWVPTTLTYRALPFIVAVAYAGVTRLNVGSVVEGIALFGLAGLGCSALLPLTISFGETQLPSISAGLAGLVIALYQVGYGIAAVGGGKLQDTVGLSTLFGWAAAVAAVMGVVSFFVVGRTATATAEGPVATKGAVA